MSKPKRTGNRTRQEKRKERKHLRRRHKKRSDNYRRYQAVLQALQNFYPTKPTGHLASHLNTLAWMISGIVGSKKTSYRAIANKSPDGNKVESRIQRFARWIMNYNIDVETYFMPYIIQLLESLSGGTLALVIDGSEVGQDCMALVISVVYGHRALPIGWLVVEGKKGHLPEELHLELVKQVAPLVPDTAKVVFLGDGEFDGTNLQQFINDDCKWDYVCRTAKNIIITENDETFTPQELVSRPGDFVAIPDVEFTQEKYGPVQIIAWWGKGEAEPIFLVTNMELAEEAAWWYKKRAIIETFFSDQKSRGFHLHKSHLSDPNRIAVLMIPACLAYIWMIYLGDFAKNSAWISVIHRNDRCDLSLFQLGLDLLEHFINEFIPIPVAFSFQNNLPNTPLPSPDDFPL